MMVDKVSECYNLSFSIKKTKLKLIGLALTLSILADLVLVRILNNTKVFQEIKYRVYYDLYNENPNINNLSQVDGIEHIEILPMVLMQALCLVLFLILSTIIINNSKNKNDCYLIKRVGIIWGIKTIAIAIWGYLKWLLFVLPSDTNIDHQFYLDRRHFLNYELIIFIVVDLILIISLFLKQRHLNIK